MDDHQKELELAHALFTRHIVSTLKDFRVTLVSLKQSLQTLRDTDGAPVAGADFQLPRHIGEMKEMNAIYATWLPALAIVEARVRSQDEAAKLYELADESLLPPSVKNWYAGYKAKQDKAAKTKRAAAKKALAENVAKRALVDSAAGDQLAELDVEADNLKARIAEL